MGATRAIVAVGLFLSTALVVAPPGRAKPRHAGPAYVPGEVVVKYRPGTGWRTRRAIGVAAGAARVVRSGDIGPRVATVRLARGTRVPAAVRRLRRDPRVAWAVPDYYGRLLAGGFIPNDPAARGKPGDWRKRQWNLLPDAGVNAPAAWENLISAGRPGGRGVTVAVIDSGVAYRSLTAIVNSDFGQLRLVTRRAPDFSRSQFVRGHDYVVGSSRPFDVVGHGTYIASVIASRADNGRLLAGLAYGARIMPLAIATDGRQRIIANHLASAIRYAARHGAQVMNMSLGFGPFLSTGDIPQVVEAIRFAHARGVVMVAASGNEGDVRVDLPARAEHVIAAGATTTSRCLAAYSDRGQGLDLVAPGGGPDLGLPEQVNCNPRKRNVRGVCQQSYDTGIGLASIDFLFDLLATSELRLTRFRIQCLAGTSASAAQVSAAAALVIASGVLGPSPGPEAVEGRLKSTAADLGEAGRDPLYGSGLLDAGRATDRSVP